MGHFPNGYNYDIEYLAGKDNLCADALSRLPQPSTERTRPEMGDLKLIRESKTDDLALSEDTLRKDTAKDAVLKKIRRYIEDGWPEKVEDDLLAPYHYRKQDLSAEDGLIMYQGRLVIPAVLREEVLKTLHHGHPGIGAMRALARYYVWWPRLDHEIEAYVKKCTACQENRIDEPEVPLYSWNIPDKPWDRVHVDFAGPFYGKQWFLLVDAYSKWVEIEPMTTTTASRVIDYLRKLCAQFGIMKQIVSDNGPQFTSEEFNAFVSLTKFNIFERHRTTRNPTD